MGLLNNTKRSGTGRPFEKSCGKVWDRIETNLALNIVGDIWFVDKDNGSSGDGKSWDDAFLTLTEAITAAQDHDCILIGQGVYSEAATINIDQAGLKIFGAGTSGMIWGPTSLKSDTCADHLITINANGVEIAGLDFICNTASKDAIQVASTVSIYKTHIHDCHFGLGTGRYGIYNGTLYDSVDQHVDRCHFYNAATAGIVMNGTRNKVTNCTFFVPAAGIGIEYVPTTSNRPDSMILDNRIIGSNSTDTGIKITNTPDAGTFLIAGNYIANCNTMITAAKGDAMFVENYTSNATGGTLFDPSP